MTPQDKAKQQAEVMMAYANGAEIEFTDVTTTWKLCPFPIWDWDTCDYRVKTPVPKVVKLEAWIDALGELRHITKDGAMHEHIGSDWKRIPSLDLEYVEGES